MVWMVLVSVKKFLLTNREMIEKIFIISFWVFSIHYTMQEGEIFGKLGDWLYEHLPKKLHDPVFECVVCMCFWHGSIVYWLFFADMKIESLWPIKIIIPFYSIEDWILLVIAAMGLNVILVKFFPHDDIKKS